MTETSASPLVSSRESGKRKHRFGAATLAASLALALGAGCSGGGGGSAPGNTATGGSPGGGQSGSSGNNTGQSGGAANPGGAGAGQSAGGARQAGGGGGATSGGATSGGASNGGAAVGSGGAIGMAGGAGTAGSGGGAVGGSSGNEPDGGTCCNTADCQPDAVKTCVCTTWQQNQCCTGTWDTFCQTTAEQKCQAEKCATEPSPPTPDGGHILKGACCAVHSTPGCDDPAIEKCTCALLGDCCTNQWDSVCVQLVREKHCEDGVRTCVCDTWQQSSCCDTQWTNACGIVAESKCGAQPSCP